MEKLTDYLLLWRQIIEKQNADNPRQQVPADGDDPWIEKARWFHECVKKRWQQPDSSRDFIVQTLKQNPGSTILDIGAGSGAWSCLLATHCASVTALEPSAAMITVLNENLAEQAIDNVHIINNSWPDTTIEHHDFTLCSHSLYGSADFANFIRAMHKRTRLRCFLLLRAPTPDGLMAEAAQIVWGQPHDSANFQIAYNALMQMGIFAHVQVENTGLWEPWTSSALTGALQDLKTKLNLNETTQYDDRLENLLSKHLVRTGDHYCWPRGVRSMLVHWSVEDNPGIT